MRVRFVSTDFTTDPAKGKFVFASSNIFWIVTICSFGVLLGIFKPGTSSIEPDIVINLIVIPLAGERRIDITPIDRFVADVFL